MAAKKNGAKNAAPATAPAPSGAGGGLEVVSYHEEERGALVTRNAIVIARRGDGTADLCVFQVMPRTGMYPRDVPVRAVVQVPYSADPQHNTWS